MEEDKKYKPESKIDRVVDFIFMSGVWLVLTFVAWYKGDQDYKFYFLAYMGSVILSTVLENRANLIQLRQDLDKVLDKKED